MRPNSICFNLHLFLAWDNNSFIVQKLKMYVGEGGSEEKVTFGKHNEVKYFQKEHFFPVLIFRGCSPTTLTRRNRNLGGNLNSIRRR